MDEVDLVTTDVSGLVHRHQVLVSETEVLLAGSTVTETSSPANISGMFRISSWVFRKNKALGDIFPFWVVFKEILYLLGALFIFSIHKEPSAFSYFIISRHGWSM